MAPKTGAKGGEAAAGGKAADDATTLSTLPKYSWRDVAKHNTAESAWMIVKGKVYDITPWLDRHPGGREVLLLGAGRECTELFASYHPFTAKPEAVLASYLVGVVTDSEFPTYRPDSGFYRTLSERVNQYFVDNKLDSKDPLPGLLRMVPVALMTAFVYAVVNQLLPAPWWAQLLAAVVFGICQGLPLLHVMHDSCHTAIGHNETWWKVLGRGALDWFAGSSMVSWQHQHVVGHHIYTNVFLADPDVPDHDGDPRRLVNRQKQMWFYKYQHIYLPLVYGTLAMKMRVDDVKEVWWRERDGPIRVNWFSSPLVRILLTKVFWATWRILIPLFYLGVPASTFWPLFAITEAVTGYWLAFNFQVSHVSVEAEWPLGTTPSDDIGYEWAVSQVRSSINYAGGPIVDFLCGALNFQIEHHLFPSVSQYHYPAIAPIVERTCREFGLPYIKYDSYTAALQAHLQYLKKMGEQGLPAHMD